MMNSEEEEAATTSPADQPKMYQNKFINTDGIITLPKDWHINQWPKDTTSIM